MKKKQVYLYWWNYSINCNENENDKSRIDHINKTYIDQGLDKETNIKNIAWFGKTMSLCNKQQLRLV